MDAVLKSAIIKLEETVCVLVASRFIRVIYASYVRS